MSSTKRKRQILRCVFEQKLWAALRVASGESRAEVGADMSVTESTLRDWVHGKSIKRHAQFMSAVFILENMRSGGRYSEPIARRRLLQSIFDFYVVKSNNLERHPAEGSSSSDDGYATPKSSKTEANAQNGCADACFWPRERLGSEDYDEHLSPATTYNESSSEGQTEKDLHARYPIAVSLAGLVNVASEPELYSFQLNKGTRRRCDMRVDGELPVTFIE